MTEEILQWVQNVARPHIPFPGRVLEIGSRNVNGSVRSLFTDAKEYIGIDMEDGEGVDIVMNAHDIYKKFDAHSFDVVICCECLEHDITFWETVKMIHGVIKFGGAIIITTPGLGFPEHKYPIHPYNFGEDAYRHLFFKGCNILDFSYLDNVAGPRISLACIGRKRLIGE